MVKKKFHVVFTDEKFLKRIDKLKTHPRQSRQEVIISLIGRSGWNNE